MIFDMLVLPYCSADTLVAGVRLICRVASIPPLAVGTNPWGCQRGEVSFSPLVVSEVMYLGDDLALNLPIPAHYPDDRFSISLQ